MAYVRRKKVMKKRVVKKRATSNAVVRAVAKKVVADMLEDKYASASINPFSGTPVSFNASISSNSEVYPLLPQISQGTNSNNRFGDKIRPKRLRVDFVITANGTLSSSQINQIRLFVLQDKSIRNSNDLRSIPVTQPGTPITAQLIDFGGTVGGFSGIPDHIMRRVNKQRYQVFHDRVFEVLSGSGQTPNPINAYTGTQQYVSGEQCYKVSFVIPTPAVLVYSGQVDTWPTNFAPFMCLGYVQPDGNALPDFLLQRVVCNWVAHLDYEDA